MPPRYAYWTILIDHAPTAFRAKEQADLLPTLHQLRRTNKDVTLKWFAHGRLWDSPELAVRPRPPREDDGVKRGRDWRPGGEHKDPRARFDKTKKKTFDKSRKPTDQGGWSAQRPPRDGPRTDRPSFSRPSGNRPPGGRPPFSRPSGHPPRHDRPHRDATGDRPPFDRPHGKTGTRPAAPKRPWQDRPRSPHAPTGPQKPWRAKPPQPARDSRPPADRRAPGHRPAAPPSDRGRAGWGKPDDRRSSWQAKPKPYGGRPPRPGNPDNRDNRDKSGDTGDKRRRAPTGPKAPDGSDSE